MSSNPPAFPTVTITTNNGPIVVPCEPVGEWFVITPELGMDANFQAFLTGQFNVTHRLSGCYIGDGPGCIECCRRAAKALDALDIDWSEMTAENGSEIAAAWSPEIKKAVAVARSVEWGCDAEYCEPADSIQEIDLPEAVVR